MANTNRYGFLNLRDVSGALVSQVGGQRVAQAVQQTAAEYTRILNEIMSDWVVRTTAVQELIELPGSGTLQPVDADGNPLPVKPGATYQVGYPIQGGATAWGTNRVSRALMTVADAERATTDALRRDADWIARHMLAAIFSTTSYTFTDRTPSPSAPNGVGDITVYGLANSDTVTYARRNGTVSTDTHYYAQADAIANATNPFPAIRAELREHPGNTGRIVTYVASNLVTSIQGLATYVPPRSQYISYGSGETLANVMQGESYGIGDEVVGEVDGQLVVEWSMLPDNYGISKLEGVPVVAMREYPAAELQGFFPEFNNIDGNHFESRMIRYAGFGVANRVAAVAFRIGNGTYAAPTGFAAPLPA